MHNLSAKVQQIFGICKFISKKDFGKFIFRKKYVFLSNKRGNCKIIIHSKIAWIFVDFGMYSDKNELFRPKIAFFFAKRERKLKKNT